MIKTQTYIVFLKSQNQTWNVLYPCRGEPGANVPLSTP